MTESIDYSRWRAAEADGRDDDADEAFRAVFQATVPEQPVSLAFTARTMEVIAEAAAVDARRARHARLALTAGGVVAATAALYAGAGRAVSFASAVFLGLINLLVTAVVRTVEAFQTGAGIWGLLSGLGRAATAVASDSSVTFAMIAISAVAIAALVTLQRLLGSDEESFR